MNKRITYVSRFARPMTSDELETLGAAAAEKNQRLDVTGVLMATGGLFYQVLEGPEEAVDGLFNTILADDRHTDLFEIRTENNVPGRMFPDWSMKTLNLDAATHVRLLPLKALVKAAFDQRLLLENMTWAIQRTIQYELQKD